VVEIDTYVITMDKYQDILLEGKPQKFEFLFCLAAQSAYETLDEDKENQFLQCIDDFENGEDIRAVYDYIKLCNISPENRKVYSEELYHKYVKLKKSFIIAEQLFNYLDVNNTDESIWVCELAETILLNRELYPEENTSYAYALLNNKKWDELLKLCNIVAEHFKLDNLWLLFKSSALDGLGLCAEALKTLDQAILDEKIAFSCAENYVNLSVPLYTQTNTSHQFLK